MLILYNLKNRLIIFIIAFMLMYSFFLASFYLTGIVLCEDLNNSLHNVINEVNELPSNEVNELPSNELPSNEEWKEPSLEDLKFLLKKFIVFLDLVNSVDYYGKEGNKAIGSWCQFMLIIIKLIFLWRI